MNASYISFLEENKDLKPYHTFGVSCTARYFASVDSHEQLVRLFSKLNYPPQSRLILGGGSNMLFLGDYDGLIVHNNFKGIEKVDENGDRVRIAVGGGIDWHKFVTHCVENKWGGVENLALIPGTVGAAPVQNIGAYGVELEDVFVSLEAFNLETQQIEVFEKEDCKFDYRDSVFKGSCRNKYIITKLTVELEKEAAPDTSYRSLSEYLEKHRIRTPDIKDVYDAVVEIREGKLPDPAQLGNAGSFFKNPVITGRKYQSLLQEHPSIPGYRMEEGKVKVPAAWLIDRAGWRGKRRGQVGTYQEQALVIVNYGGATGAEILDFASSIRRSVEKMFDIKLKPEVNIISTGDEDWKQLLMG